MSLLEKIHQIHGLKLLYQWSIKRVRIFCEGHRPISLLCNDQKLLTYILAKRMQKNIVKLNHPDETGFISGQRGANNIRRTLNIITWAKKNRQNFVFISFDALEAFDTVNCQFLYKTLAVVGFHPTFMDWVRVIYTNPRLSTSWQNGCCLDFFYLERGVRQGGCLSPSL